MYEPQITPSETYHSYRRWMWIPQVAPWRPSCWGLDISQKNNEAPHFCLDAGNMVDFDMEINSGIWKVAFVPRRLGALWGIGGVQDGRRREVLLREASMDAMLGPSWPRSRVVVAARISRKLLHARLKYRTISTHRLFRGRWHGAAN